MTQPDLRRRTMLALTTPAVLMLALNGCLNGTAANEANFRKALAPLVKDRFCRRIQVARVDTGSDPQPYPIVIPAKPVPYADDEKTRAVLEQAAAGGALTRKKVTVPDRQGKQVDAWSYSPTATGAPVFRTVTNDKRSYAAFCMGTGKIDKIVRWTEPADAFERTVTEVTYTYSATDLPDGAPAEAVATVTKPQQTTTMLMLANDGWQVAQ